MERGGVLSGEHQEVVFDVLLVFWGISNAKERSFLISGAVEVKICVVLVVVILHQGWKIPRHRAAVLVVLSELLAKGRAVAADG